MGGNALSIPVNRFSKTQGELILKELTPHLTAMFHHWVPTKSVKEKTDFGDMDIICSLPKVDIHSWIQENVKPQEITRNSNVISFEFMGIQVDLIIVPKVQFTWAYYYYSNNDLGNLIGRIARAIGFKFGGQGFIYEFQRDAGNYSRDLTLSFDLQKTLSFLGFSTFRHTFETYEDMFQYVMSSCLVDPTMFLLENRNFEGRHRDKKRKVYTAFLEWLHARYDMKLLGKPEYNKAVHLTRSKFVFPYFADKFKDTEDDYVLYRKRKEKFNGKVVMEVTGLKGRELGDFIQSFRTNINFNNWLNDPHVDMKAQIKRIYQNYYAPLVKPETEDEATLAVVEVPF